MGTKRIEPVYEVNVQSVDLSDGHVISSSCYCETFEEARSFFDDAYAATRFGMGECEERHARTTDFRCCWIKDDDDLFIIKLQKIVSD